MAFNWKEYFNLACFLGSKSTAKFSQEAAYRSAVSRAYYSAFCLARNNASINHNFKPTGKAEDHANLINHYMRRGDIEIANYLYDLRRWRNSCDYYDDCGTIRSLTLKVNNALSAATEVITLL